MRVLNLGEPGEYGYLEEGMRHPKTQQSQILHSTFPISPFFVTGDKSVDDLG